MWAAMRCSRPSGRWSSRDLSRVNLELGLRGAERQRGVAADEVLGARHPRRVERRGHHHELAADPPQLGQEGVTAVREHVLEHVARDDGVEGVVGEREPAAVAEQRSVAVEALGLEGDVEADDPQLRLEEGQVAGGVTDVEHAVGTGTERRAHQPGDLDVAVVAVERGPGRLRVGDRPRFERGGSTALAGGRTGRWHPVNIVVGRHGRPGRRCRRVDVDPAGRVCSRRAGARR